MIYKGIASILHPIDKYSLRLSKARTNPAANLGRSPLMRSYCYASAGDRPTLFARFALDFAPFMQYAG
jgi:hypothetical protein